MAEKIWDKATKTLSDLELDAIKQRGDWMERAVNKSQDIMVAVLGRRREVRIRSDGKIIIPRADELTTQQLNAITAEFDKL